jgi:hypothetical protein
MRLPCDSSHNGIRNSCFTGEVARPREIHEKALRVRAAERELRRSGLAGGPLNTRLAKKFRYSPRRMYELRAYREGPDKGAETLAVRQRAAKHAMRYWHLRHGEPPSRADWDRSNLTRRLFEGYEHALLRLEFLDEGYIDEEGQRASYPNPNSKTLEFERLLAEVRSEFGIGIPTRRRRYGSERRATMVSAVR